VFYTVVDFIFQSVFQLKIYQNNIFFYFLNYFFISAYQNNLKILKNNNLKKTNSKTLKSATRSQK
jgi:hypothetical protein